MTIDEKKFRGSARRRTLQRRVRLNLLNRFALLSLGFQLDLHRAAERVRDRAPAFRLLGDFPNSDFSMPCRPSTTTFSFDVVSLIPDSPLSAMTVAVTCVLAIEPPLRPTVALSAMA